MNNAIKPNGFSLVELMVAMLLSIILLMGVGGAYIAIKRTLNDVHDLENAQEVLRSSSDVLARSIKQAVSVTLIDSSTLLLEQQLSTNQATSCTGSMETASFTERYSLAGDRLQCSVNDQSAQTVVQGILAISFSLNGTADLVSVRIAPRGLPDSFPQAVLNEDGAAEAYIRLELALKSIILRRDT